MHLLLRTILLTEEAGAIPDIVGIDVGSGRLDSSRIVLKHYLQASDIERACLRAFQSPE